MSNRFLAPCAALAIAACSDDVTPFYRDSSTALQTGAVLASVQLTDGEPSDSTFALIVDSSTKTFAFADGSPLISGLSAGPHTLTLKVAAENCTVTGSDRMSITVSPGATAYVAFAVDCTTMGVEITTRTTGFDHPSSFGVLLNGESLAPRPPEPNGVLLVSRLVPGPYTVALTALGDNCHVVGGNPITVTVVNRTVTPIVFEIVCVNLEKIAYEEQSATSPGGSTIRLVNPDGSGEVDLGNGSTPSWSPDGSRLVFFFPAMLCTPYDGCMDTSHLAVMDADGGNIQALPAGFSPAWSPIGDVIAFVGVVESHLGTTAALFLTSPGGSLPVRLPIQGVDAANHPAWSPDGLRIAFECFFAPASHDVCVINKDGTGLVRFSITDQPGALAQWPAWSPDGRSIALTSVTPSSAQIEVMAADGSSQVFLVNGNSASWSRDGSKLVFARSDGLFEIGADGSNLKRLTSGHDGAPAWRP